METVKQPLTHLAFLKWQVLEYNKISKPDKDGFDCTACKNRRYFATIDYAENFALRPCTCNSLIARQRNENM